MWLQSNMCSFTEADKVPFTCLPVPGDTSWCSETLTFMCLEVLPIYKALQLPHVKFVAIAYVFCKFSRLLINFCKQFNISFDVYLIMEAVAHEIF